MSATRVGDLSVPRTGASNTAEGNGPEQASRQAPSDADAPNYFDGPMTFFAIVDRTGHAMGFGSERFAAELLERWEERLPQFAPYRMIKLVEQREV